LGKKIQGVQKGYPAHHAGLRNGQKLLGFFINKNNSIEAQIKKANNKVQIIKFDPM
jgi:predicted metalloprotease with PDZ domain